MVLPSEQALLYVIRRTASLQNHLGSEIGQRPLVLPNGKFFPDTFTADAPSTARLMRRLQEHAAMTDVPIETRVLGGEEPGDGEKHQCGGDCKGDCGGKGCKDCDGSCHERSQPAKSCGTGCGSGCGIPADVMGDQPRLVDLGESWRVQVPITELRQPVVLTTNLARALGFIFLVETQSASRPKYDNMDVTADLTSTLLGFGPLLLAGSHIYSKSCGGPQIRRVTALGCAELAMATILFATLHGHDIRSMQRELEITQWTAIKEADEWLRDRPRILERFGSDLASLERGEIPLEPTPEGFFSKLFGRGKKARGAADDPDASIAELEAMLGEVPVSRKGRNSTKADPRADE